MFNFKAEVLTRMGIDGRCFLKEEEINSKIVFLKSGEQFYQLVNNENIYCKNINRKVV